MIKIIFFFIPSMNVIIIIEVFFIMIIFNSIWFNTVICIHNTLFLWYVTADRIYFTKINFINMAPRMLGFTNNKNLLCNSTCYKNKNLGARKLIFLMPQITITINYVFSFTDKTITIKGPIIFIEVSILSPKQFQSKIQFIFRSSIEKCFYYSVDLFSIIVIWMITCNKLGR